MKDTKTIEFTRKQFEALLKLVYLGNWMVNAHRETGILEEYEGMESYIFSQAEKFGFKKYVDHEAKDGKDYYPTREFEENTDVSELHDEYDEETFWDEIIDRLGERDFLRKYGEIDIEKMSNDERFEKLCECEGEWAEEISRYGIRRLGVRKD